MINNNNNNNDNNNNNNDNNNRKTLKCFHSYHLLILLRCRNIKQNKKYYGNHRSSLK